MPNEARPVPDFSPQEPQSPAKPSAHATIPDVDDEAEVGSYQDPLAQRKQDTDELIFPDSLDPDAPGRHDAEQLVALDGRVGLRRGARAMGGRLGGGRQARAPRRGARGPAPAVGGAHLGPGRAAREGAWGARSCASRGGAARAAALVREARERTRAMHPSLSNRSHSPAQLQASNARRSLPPRRLANATRPPVACARRLRIRAHERACTANRRTHPPASCARAVRARAAHKPRAPARRPAPCARYRPPAAHVLRPSAAPTAPAPCARTRARCLRARLLVARGCDCRAGP